MTPPFRRVLVANRGEIALRIIRACHEMGMEAVAVYSDADAAAAHVRAADHAVRLGPPPAAESYLRIDAVVAAARRGRGRGRPPRLRLPVGAGGVRPGGRGCRPRLGRPASRGHRRPGRQAGGPADRPRGGRAPRAREPSSRAVVDGPDQVEAVLAAARDGGLPAPREGRGRRRRARDAARRLRRRAASAPSLAGSREAASAFGDGAVYLEREILPARHVEVQLLGDATGNVVAIGERDCSTQRRHQKLIEEAPGPGPRRDRAPPPPRDGRPDGVGRRTAQRGHLRVPLRPRRRVLVPRGEHPAPGGAPRDRARRRPRHRRRAVPPGCRPAPVGPGPGRGRAGGASDEPRHRAPDLGRGPGPPLRPGARPDHALADAVRARDPGGHGRRGRRSDPVRVRPAHREAHRPRGGSAGRDRPPAPRGRRGRGRRHPDHPARSTGRCWPSRGSSTRRSWPRPGSTPTGTARAPGPRPFGPPRWPPGSPPWRGIDGDGGGAAPPGRRRRAASRAATDRRRRGGPADAPSPWTGGRRERIAPSPAHDDCRSDRARRAGRRRPRPPILGPCGSGWPRRPASRAIRRSASPRRPIRSPPAADPADQPEPRRGRSLLVDGVPVAGPPPAFRRASGPGSRRMVPTA